MRVLKALAAVLATLFLFAAIMAAIGYKSLYFDPWRDAQRLKDCPRNKRGHVYVGCYARK